MLGSLPALTQIPTQLTFWHIDFIISTALCACPWILPVFLIRALFCLHAFFSSNQNCHLILTGGLLLLRLRLRLHPHTLRSIRLALLLHLLVYRVKHQDRRHLRFMRRTDLRPSDARPSRLLLLAWRRRAGLNTLHSPAHSLVHDSRPRIHLP